MWLVSLISYIDRNTLALLAPAILAETGLSAEQYGYIISAFSVAYMIGNPLWGCAARPVRSAQRDVVGRVVLDGRLGRACLRERVLELRVRTGVIGVREGATFPGGLRTASQTLPEGLRSRGIAVAYSGGSLGAIVTPLLVTPIALRFGWRGAFLFTGFVGLLWLAVWAVISRRLPKQHAAVEAKKELPRLTDPRLWGFMLAYALGAQPLGFVLYGAAIYLRRCGASHKPRWARCCGFHRLAGNSDISFGAGSPTGPMGGLSGYSCCSRS